MVGILYDHILAIIIVGTIFVAAVVIVPNISYLNLLYLDQQQLRNVALETLKAMLLDEGYPSNWGTTYNFDPNAVERFGLALFGSSSFYVSDPDKVQRLVVDNPLGFLDYNRIRGLLNLQDYGFSVRIIPPFNVTVNDLSQGSNLQFKVSVNFHDGRPIPNADVNAMIVYAKSKGSSYSIHVNSSSSSTDELGRCTIEKVLPQNFDDLVVVFKTTVADVSSVTAVHRQGFQPNVEVADINVVGDNVSLTMPPTGDPGPQANRWVYNIMAVTADVDLLSLYNGSKSEESKLNYGSFNLWSRVFGGLKDSDPVLLIFDIYSVDPNQSPARRQLLMAGPYPYLSGARVTHYGSTAAIGANAVNLQRSVIIADMTYIFELTLWKE